MSDLISRADAVGIINDYIGRDYMTPMSRLLSVRCELQELPAAPAIRIYDANELGIKIDDPKPIPKEESFMHNLAKEFVEFFDHNVIEVVHCKDCIHGEGRSDLDDLVYCHKYKGWYPEKHFCADGARE